MRNSALRQSKATTGISDDLQQTMTVLRGNGVFHRFVEHHAHVAGRAVQFQFREAAGIGLDAEVVLQRRDTPGIVLGDFA